MQSSLLGWVTAQNPNIGAALPAGKTWVPYDVSGGAVKKAPMIQVAGPGAAPNRLTAMCRVNAAVRPMITDSITLAPAHPPSP